MARAGKTSGRAPRVSVAALAINMGVPVSMVRQYQKMSKSYNDSARKWAARHGVQTANQWRPMSVTAISRTKNPAEYFQRAFANLDQRLQEGVSNLLNTRAREYADNLATAMASSSQYSLDKRMQTFVDAYQRGIITADQVLQSTGGRPLTAVYRSAPGGVDIDFGEMLDSMVDIIAGAVELIGEGVQSASATIETAAELLTGLML